MRVKPQIQGALLTLAGEALVLIGIWVYLGLRMGLWSYDEYDRYIWLTANLPVARSLWRGDLNAGDDVEALAQTWRPHVVSRFGHWVELTWYPHGLSRDSISLISVCVTARDGKIVSANIYTDDGLLARDFFDTRTASEHAEYLADFGTYVDKLQAQRENTAQQDDTADRNQPVHLETD